jgi:hypothetical protein
MALKDILMHLNHLKAQSLTKAQKAKLRGTFTEHRRDLEKEMKAVDKALAELKKITPEE